MNEAFHIVALGGLSMSAVFWKNTGTFNTFIKIGFVLLTAWAAVVVAKDWLS